MYDPYGVLYGVFSADVPFSRASRLAFAARDHWYDS